MNEKLRLKNDNFRKTFLGGRVVVTPTIMNSPYKEAIIQMVKDYSTFTMDNDPYNEHGQGSFHFHGSRFSWRIDYFDDSYRFFEEDGNRVLTIMHSSEN